MKRILFYYDNFCGEKARGGTEVATFRIASALKESGEWEVCNAFRSYNGDDRDASLYSDVIRLGKDKNSFIKELSGFIRSHEIDVVVNMSRFFRHKLLLEASKKSGRDVKIVFMQHFAPGSEKKKSTYRSAFHLLRLDPLNPLYILRCIFYPLFKLPRTLAWSKVYREIYENSDKVVLLSEGYFSDYDKIAGYDRKREKRFDSVQRIEPGQREDSKFIAIPNIFEAKESSLQNRENLKECNPESEEINRLDDCKFSGEELDEKRVLAEKEKVEKEKRVLILSRMDEIQKRISLALRIWQKIETQPDLEEWKLDIVGTGHDTRGLKRLAKRLGLKNVVFHGWQNPLPFLKRSEILMSTSEYEGLPLSILEARIYGCIPVAFDSYASLRDVVEDGKNGVIIPGFGDIDLYAKKLSGLMRDKEGRRRLAENGPKDMERFSSKRIAESWQKMLSSLI